MNKKILATVITISFAVIFAHWLSIGRVAINHADYWINETHRQIIENQNQSGGIES